MPDPQAVEETSVQPETRRSSAWKWWIAIVLFLATVLTYLDRQTVSLCGSMIREEMKLSNEQYGQLLSAFRWTYALMHVVAGFAADRLPLRMTYALAVLVWSAAGAAAAFVTRFAHLLMTRQLLGIGEAFNWPCATRIVANLLPPEDRGLASGIFNSGSAVGSLVAPFIILPLAQLFGWRVAFLVIGGLGLFWVALWLWTTHHVPLAHNTARKVAIVRPRAAATGSRLSATVTWIRQVLLHPAFWMLFVVGVSVNPCWYFLNDWIPTYMRDQRGMSQLTAGMITVPMFLAADLGNLAGGGLVKYLTIRRWSLRQARGTTLALAAILIVPVAWITQVPNAVAAVAMLAAAAFGMTAILANYTACQQDFSFANVGAVAGILGMACNVFAALVNPWIGRYVDQTGTYYLIFVLIGSLPVLAFVALLIFDTLIHSRARSGPTSQSSEEEGGTHQ